MTQPKRSDWALAHAEACRQRMNEDEPPSWDDVAAAYDAGIYHALGVRLSGHRRKLNDYMTALRVMNAVTWSQEHP